MSQGGLYIGHLLVDFLAGLHNLIHGGCHGALVLSPCRAVRIASQLLFSVATRVLESTLNPCSSARYCLIIGSWRISSGLDELLDLNSVRLDLLARSVPSSRSWSS